MPNLAWHPSQPRQVTGLTNSVGAVSISRRSALAWLGVPLLAGCSGPINFTPPEYRASPAPTNTTPPERVVEPGFYARSTTGTHVSLEGAKPVGLIFSTPHLDGRIGEVLVGERIAYDAAQRLDQTAPLKAPAGFRFVAFTAQAGRPVFVEDEEHPVEVRLDRDGAAMPVRNLFGSIAQHNYQVAWECIVACIPADGAAVLEIVDEEKTIRIDLVQGAPIVDEAWKATEGFRARKTIAFDPPEGIYQRQYTAQPAGYEPASGVFHMGMRPSNASMAPWTPEHGWAPAGTQWLTIPMSARVGFQGIEAGTNIDLDLPASFTYTSADGHKAKLVTPRTISTDAVRREQTDVRPTFQVSGRDAQATLTFSAAGQIHVDFQQVSDVPGSFTGANEPVRFNLTYQDAESRF